MKHVSYISESAASVRLGCRKSAESIEPWLDKLNPADRAMMKLYLRGGGFAEIGRLCRMRPENVARRVKKAMSCIAAFKLCEQNRRLFSGCELQIAKDYFLRGKSITQIAASTRESYKTINKIMLEVKSKMESLKTGHCERSEAI